MSDKQTHKHKVLKAAAVLVLLAIVGVAIYLGTYYRPDSYALASMQDTDQVRVVQLEGGDYAFVPINLMEDPDHTGLASKQDPIVFRPEADVDVLVFYPGGKVGKRSYAPLAQECAKRGMVFVLVDMPFNMALLDMDADDDVADQLVNVDDRYLGGHSLGGVSACMHVARCGQDYKGLVLLAAYSTEDLTASGLDVLSIYGSEDGVLNMQRYRECLPNLGEAHVEELIIQGGNHAGFADYGVQSGDGQASISNDEQMAQTADAISRFMTKEGNGAV